ncbi:IS1-like element transposase [Candidatus Thiothrix phosphatis]|uniref:IS1-like element transposase n=1 Tax=Candidatus Thiothrix phosphatis TaxID=3112415 RepID=UPI0035C8AE94
MTDKISDMAMNGSGVRDTGRVLGISITTVIAHLKNSPHRRLPHPVQRSQWQDQNRGWCAGWMNSGRMLATNPSNADPGMPGRPISNGSLPMRLAPGPMKR